MNPTCGGLAPRQGRSFGPGTGVTVKFPKLRNFVLAPTPGKVQLPGRMPGCARVLLAFPVRCRTLRPKERSEGWSGWPRKGDTKAMTDKDNKGSMTVAEAGRKGGETVRNERGREFYETIGRKGGATVKAERGRACYAGRGGK